VIEVELVIVSQGENKLVGRKEYVFEAKAEGSTPSRKELVEAIHAKLNVPAVNIVIDKVEHNYGTKKARIFAKSYPSPQNLKKYEKEYKKQRESKKEAKEKK